jgi:hypothetical protein
MWAARGTPVTESSSQDVDPSTRSSSGCASNPSTVWPESTDGSIAVKPINCVESDAVGTLVHTPKD